MCEPAQTPDHPTPRFSVAALFTEIFSNNDLASWLLSRDQQPPTALSPSMMERYVAVNSLSSNDSKTASILLRRSSALELSEDVSSDDETIELSCNSKRRKLNCEHTPEIAQVQERKCDVPEPEKLSFVCHYTKDDYCFLSITDNRTPLVFMEKPSATVPGIRRSVGLKRENGFVIVGYLWLEDGRSAMAIVFLSFEPVVYSERHFLLLAKYPEFRYPRVSDILESLVAIEVPVCEYCSWKGLQHCECHQRIFERTMPSLPAADQRDLWSLVSWNWTIYEPGLKKFIAILSNYTYKATITAAVYHHVSPIFNNPETRHLGFEHYLSTIMSYLSCRIYRIHSGLLNSREEAGRKGRFRRVRATRKEEKAQMISLQPMDEAIQGSSLNADPITGPPGLGLSMADDSSHHALFSSPHATTSPSRGQCVTGIAFTADKSPLENTVAQNGPDDQGGLSTQQPDRAMFSSYLDEIDNLTWVSAFELSCKFCPERSFKRKFDLKRHVKTIHLEQADFACAFCSKKFTRMSHLSAHVSNVHEQKKDVMCSICSKYFATQALYRKHVLRTHKTTIDDQR